MQLAITVLGKRQSQYIEPILAAVSRCKCSIAEIRSTDLTESTAAYMLIEGNWNHIAKLENLLETLQKQLKIHIHKARQEKSGTPKSGLPYTLEAMSLDQNDIILSIVTFLVERNIAIEEIKAYRYPAAYIQTPVFSTQLIIIIPSEQRLLQLREDFLDFCDQLNLDAILEPIKR
ncbi:MAG: transcriptional regulator [Gammaproteobacteria bacterium]|uniref:glycine cleavage system protein R n=1 Tax=Methylotuvimicrobium sp. KM1 TaxID=3377707 RepID=UPI001E1005F4|nr:transcriptional regulator [Gammaproteobacteria bacterium]